MRKRLQAGFLTCILPSGSFPSAQSGQWTTPHGFPILEQMLTAARPSRILTAFPFRYPKARGLETCSRTMHLAKNSRGSYAPAFPVSRGNPAFFSSGAETARSLAAAVSASRARSRGHVAGQCDQPGNGLIHRRHRGGRRKTRLLSGRSGVSCRTERMRAYNGVGDAAWTREVIWCVVAR